VQTEEEAKRKNIKGLFLEYIKDEKIKLRPISIECVEKSGSSSFVKFVFEESSLLSGPRTIEVETTGSGLVDSIFSSCNKHYGKEYNSLIHLSLDDLLIRPIFSMARSESQTDASTDVILKMSVQGSPSEFKNRSKSIVYSSFVCILSAFQFYINCQKTFERLLFLVEDAHARDRHDLVEKYSFSMSKITVVNAYEKQ